MAFEQSPELGDGGIQQRESLRGWLAKHERGLYAVTGALLLAAFAMGARALGVFSGEPGGLDGCIVDAAGEPVSGTVQVGATQRLLDSGGCFFFAELPSGKYKLFIQPDSGASALQRVAIVSGQALVWA